MSDLPFYGYFTASKVGKTGLADVTVDIDKIEKATGTRTAVVTGGSATEGRRGYYYYRLASATPITHDYVAIFMTADATVDQQHVAAVRVDFAEAQAAALAYLDAAISTRLASASYSAPPSAGTVADAILDDEEVSAGVTVREALAAAGSAADPLTNPLDGYASGTGGAALKRISSGQLTVLQPVLDDGFVRIIGGDDYDAADGRRLDLSGADWPTLTGGSVVWIFGDTTLDGVVVAADTVGLELTAAQSAALLAQRAGRQSYTIVATLASGNTVTLAKGAPCLIE